VITEQPRSAPIWRSRPGAEAIRAAAPGGVTEVGDRIWMSPGLSNSFLIGADDPAAGCVVLNAGMGFEGPVHRDDYATLHQGPIRYLVMTQGHYDHVGGTDALRQPGTLVVMQAAWRTWRDDNERLSAFRARNAAFAWADAIGAALEHAAAQPDGFPAQSAPEPDVVVEDSLDLEVGGRRLRLLSTPGGETTDSLVVHLPDEGVAFCGNLFGALFGHVPNLVTMRGDRYRDPLLFVESVERVRALGVDVLHTGHFDAIAGADVVDAELARLAGAVRHLHDAVVDGMEAGRTVDDLMRSVTLPPDLAVGEGYGKVAWDVRAIWEMYAGWFHHRSTTELYPVRADLVDADLARLAGPDALAEAAGRRAAEDDLPEALRLAEVALAGDPEHDAARAVAREVHERLLERSTNFWESAWLRRELRRLG
jgi:glyoxylase-like metal-dependent hydrolase (beta-lactamase superfamily II)